ncbi:hypothetical protein A2U01_0060291, partial [Trifolium medium]|nr:hypothetical protein [Trifolium medium]
MSAPPRFDTPNNTPTLP